MTRRDWIWLAAFLLALILWHGDRKEASALRRDFRWAAGEIMRLMGEQRIADKAWIRQHEDLKKALDRGITADREGGPNEP